MHVAVCGGGVIGSSIAYYLSKTSPTQQITLIERCEELCTASAKAGGFLAYVRRDIQQVLQLRLHTRTIDTGLV